MKFDTIQLSLLFYSIAISCPPVSEPNNGLVVYDDSADSDGNHYYMTVATFSCSAGFGILGAKTSVCKEDGSGHLGMFSPAPPTCEGELIFLNRNTRPTIDNKKNQKLN